MAMPPNNGTGWRCQRSATGRATNPRRRARCSMTIVSPKLKLNATSRTATAWFMSVPGSPEDAETPVHRFVAVQDRLLLELSDSHVAAGRAHASAEIRIAHETRDGSHQRLGIPRRDEEAVDAVLDDRPAPLDVTPDERQARRRRFEKEPRDTLVVARQDGDRR